VGRGDRESARMHDSEWDDETADDPRPGFSIGGVHWIAWVFILFALGDLVWLIVNAQLTDAPDFLEFLDYAIKVVPAIVAVLLPAVLLMRHPDAVTRAPSLLLGTFLFALVQGLLVLAVPLGQVFETITPGSAETGIVPLSAVYNTLTLLIAAAGLILIARGLTLARWSEDRWGPLTGVLLLAATIFATAVGILSISQSQLPDPLPIDYLVYLAASVLLGIVRMVAWSYLAVMAWRGWFAGEQPVAGWRLATFGGGFIVVALVLINLAGLFVITDQTFGVVYGWTIYGLYALGHFALLLAFAVGLPSLDDDDEYDSEDEDEDDEFDAEEDEFDADEADGDDPGFRGGPVRDDEFPGERRR
jgi:hypothetical protein